MAPNTGEISSEQNNIPVSVQLLPEGRFATNSKSNQLHSLSMVLHLMRSLSFKKKRNSLKKLLNDAPTWLNQHYRLVVPVSTEDFKALAENSTANFKDLTGLQTYWVLLDMATSPKIKIPAELLVRHVLSIYGEDRWGIQLAAMEGILKRITTAQKDDLTIASRPSSKEIFGIYQVRRKGSKIRPYSVLLASNKGLDGSCSCKDFQKNTLQFCKHLGAVLNHWYGKESLQQRFLKAGKNSNKKIRLRWVAEKGTKQLADPLNGLKLALPTTTKNQGKTATKLINFFAPAAKKSEKDLLLKSNKSRST